MRPDQEETVFRLNRFIAMCGGESRRSAESLIRAGRVRVNGSTVRDLSFRVDPKDDEVMVNGTVMAIKPKSYLIVNKPRGVVCAVSDKFSRTVMDILPREISETGVFPVGRLDKDSEGLLILTNDGAMFQKIAHPGSRILKTYEVLVQRIVSNADLFDLMKGSSVGSRIVRPIEARMIEKQPAGRWLSITIGEGLKREIRVMTESRGLKVIRLVRRKIGSLELRSLPEGGFLQVEGERLLEMIFYGGSV